MAAPNFSPGGGVGSSYTDPQSGSTYRFTGSGWQQMSSGARTNSSSGQVLGSNTIQTSPAPRTNTPAPSNSNMKNQNANPGAGYFWDAADGWKQAGADSGGGPDAEFLRALDDAYGGFINSANQAETGVKQGYESDKQNLESRIANAKTDYATEEQNLLGSTDKEQSSFNKVLQSALSNAIRSYNALQQQARSRFGAGSSAGQAVGELAQQEYFRQQGDVQQKGVEGTAQFSEERGKIRQFVATKVRDLDQYKNEALGELEKNLRDQINSINARRDEANFNKAQARLNALQEARQRADQISQADKEFRQNLGLAAVNQLQQVSGRTFTPAEIKAYIEEFMSDLPSNVGAGPAQGGGTTSVAASFNPRASEEDEFSPLSSGVAPKTTSPAGRRVAPTSYLA